MSITRQKIVVATLGLIIGISLAACDSLLKNERDVSTEYMKDTTSIMMPNKKGPRVKEEYLNRGVSILTIDGHEYIHYRDGRNAASTGGICHKIDCSHLDCKKK